MAGTVNVTPATFRAIVVDIETKDASFVPIDPVENRQGGSALGLRDTGMFIKALPVHTSKTLYPFQDFAYIGDAHQAGAATNRSFFVISLDGTGSQVTTFSPIIETKILRPSQLANEEGFSIQRVKAVYSSILDVSSITSAPSAAQTAGVVTVDVKSMNDAFTTANNPFITATNSNAAAIAPSDGWISVEGDVYSKYKNIKVTLASNLYISAFHGIMYEWKSGSITL